jgi:hypothetical protein
VCSSLRTRLASALHAYYPLCNINITLNTNINSKHNIRRPHLPLCTSICLQSARFRTSIATSNASNKHALTAGKGLIPLHRHEHRYGTEWHSLAHAVSRRKKTKCSGERPTCSFCKRLSQTCEWNKFRPARSGSSEAHLSSIGSSSDVGISSSDEVLLNKIATIESKLDELNNTVRAYDLTVFLLAICVDLTPAFSQFCRVFEIQLYLLFHRCRRLA